MTDAKPTTIDRKLFSLPSQEETNYSPAGGTTNHACANCRFFTRSGWDGAPECYLISNWPEPIEPTGVCDRHETGTPDIIEVVPVPVVIVEPEYDEFDSAEMSLSVPKGLVERVKEYVASLRPRATPEPAPFQVFKAANGKKAFIARFSGKWIDREGEILADKAHDEYVTRVQKGIVKPPELWMWHAKGTRHGEAVTVWKSGGFVCAAGYLDDTPAGNKAFEYYQKNSGSIKLSHMFHFPPASKVNGVYYDYNTVEITTLPDGAEAFPYTTFMEVQTMSIPEAGKQMIEAALGADVLQNALAMDKTAEADSKKLDETGIASKGYDKYDESKTVSFAEQVKTLGDQLTATQAALKTATDALALLTDVPNQIKALTGKVTTLEEQLAASQKAENAALERGNTLERQLAELKDVQAPASQSESTVVSDSEKSLVEQMMTAAKQLNQKSLVDMAVDGLPTVGS